MASRVEQEPIHRGAWIKEHTLVLGFIFLGLPVFDMVNGILIVRGFLPENALGSPSQIGRLLATFMLLILTPRQGYSPFWLAALGVLFVVETLSGFRLNSTTGVLFGYMTVFRFFYLYLLFKTLFRYVRGDLSLIGQYVKFNLNFISASIVFAFVTGLGNSTYGWGFGTKGFFASGNGLGIYLGVGALTLVAMRHYRLYRNVGNGSFLLAFISLGLIGTKTSFLLGATLLLVVAWQSRLRIVAIPAVGFLFYSLLDVMSALVSLYFDVVASRFSNAPSIEAFIFSGRDSYVEGALEVFNGQDVGLLRWCFGGGAYLSFQNPIWTPTYDTLETDLFDVLFMYGLFGALGYLLLLLYSLKLHVRYPYFLLGMTLLAAHSILAGHVLFNGMSSTLVVVLVVIGQTLSKETGGLHTSSLVTEGDTL